jgi:hypothetical protein
MALSPKGYGCAETAEAGANYSNIEEFWGGGDDAGHFETRKTESRIQNARPYENDKIWGYLHDFTHGLDKEMKQSNT